MVVTFIYLGMMMCCCLCSDYNVLRHVGLSLAAALFLMGIAVMTCEYTLSQASPAGNNMPTLIFMCY
uniref:Uncharacterized protein n=1 Tax=Scleropages formosus TaxID=113540 RepID=A0A8C9QT82_SCLFO